MPILKVQSNKIYKLAWEHNLQLCGVSKGDPQFIGNMWMMDTFFRALERNNLI